MGAANPLALYRRYVIEAWAVHTAVSVGLFEVLREPKTLVAVAAAQQWNLSALAALVRALEACGHLVETAPETFALTERSRELLLPESAAYIGHALSFMKTTPAYLRYPEVLAGSAAVGLSESQWSYVTRGSAMYATAGVKSLLRNFADVWRRPSLRILDVGCGQGVYLMQLARALPDAKLVGIDPTARVVEDARARLASLGASRPEVRLARLEEVTDAFDVIMFNQIFHVTGTAISATLLTEARKRLAPGGHVFIQEIVDGGSDPSPALFGLNMRMLFDEGCVLTAEQLSDLLERAGFVDVEVRAIEQASTPGLAYVVAHV
jgi:SAM-dependent methyltransferase